MCIKVAVSTGQRNTIIFNRKDGVLYMTYRTRIKYTPEQKADIWSRWEKGESLNAIARDLGRGHSAVELPLRATSGLSCLTNLGIYIVRFADYKPILKMSFCRPSPLPTGRHI